jgi:hypothetical protein
MSHHLDSPASRRDPRLNVTDLYAFDGDDATVLTMIVNSSLAGAGRPAGFHPEGRYEFKIHLDGAPAEQLTYRLSFAPEDGSGTQRVAIDRLAGPEAGDDSAAGARIAEGHTTEAISGSGVRAWCGAAADPFYLDLHHLAHILEGLQHEQQRDRRPARSLAPHRRFPPVPSVSQAGYLRSRPARGPIGRAATHLGQDRKATSRSVFKVNFPNGRTSRTRTSVSSPDRPVLPRTRVSVSSPDRQVKRVRQSG